MPEDHWESELETVDGCSKAPEAIKILIEPIVKVKIDSLMSKYPNIEWFAYLLGAEGERDENWKHTVADIYVPTQKVTATSVDDIICDEFNDLPIIGAIHSHHGMGTGFSGTDHAFVNQNHDISLVISKAAIAGQVRWQTPCGCLKIVPATVRPKIDVDFDEKSFLETAVSNISEKRYTQSTTNTGTHLGGQTWVNGKLVPPGKADNRTAAQRSYTNGTSIKEAAMKSDELQNETEDLTSQISADGFSGEQSLLDALDESFPPEQVA